jgi:very-short-patch-repair endonuclease
MATGKRVLIVSHAEPALAVLRDQLPESIRPLAISITASEREGIRQVETAVGRLQSILQTIREPDQIRAIREAEDTIVGLRQHLETVDREIADFAQRQLAPSLGGKRAAELAEAVVAAADRHAWFVDRPNACSAEAAPTDSEIEALRAARRKLGAQLNYLGVVLPSLDDLPDGEKIAQWHDDLLRAQAHGEAARRDLTVRVRLDNLRAVDSALETADALKELVTIRARARSKPWLEGLADRAISLNAANDVLALVKVFLEEAAPVAEARRAYLARSIELPDGFEATGRDAIALIGKLAEGGRAYGLLAFKERALRPLVEAIRVQGKPPASPADYAFIRDHLAWRERVDRLSARWRPLAEEVGAPQVSTTRELVDLVADLRLELVEAPAVNARVSVRAQAFLPGGLPPQALWFEPARSEAIEDSLRNAAAAAKLSAVRNEIGRVAGFFGSETGQIGVIANEFLKDGLGLERLSPEKAGELWTAIRGQIEAVRRHAADFDAVTCVTDEIHDGGALEWAIKLRREPATGAADSLLPPDWRDAWDWAAVWAHLRKIDDREKLRRLGEERLRLDRDIRRTFEALVRDRTYLSLQRSMTPRLKAALQMVAAAVSQIGKGLGPRAQRARRDAQRAMADCYDGIPCWIMPTWRVAEQLPGEVGTFDLVVLDEASQSEIRELPALLRGRKILVVGDDRQVSPTAPFIDNDKIERLERNWLRDQPYKILLLPGSSLYNFARVMFPEGFVMLREHFRCVEPIIRFSSDFYPQPLIPLRIPAAHERLDPPLIDIYVPDGRRTGVKQNLREAEIIVEEIRRTVGDDTIARIHAADRWRTIGVISLIGAHQAALINRMILEALGEEVVLRHRIACGDSATFQGNERDIIFLSMVADPGSKKALTAPLYEQRFNVAMSRARDRLVLVRSVHEDELSNPSDLKVRVIRHFKDPMAGAKPPGANLEEKCESNFERTVLRRLLDKGHRVTPQVGAQGYRIDLVVEGKSGQRLAVECDGDKYHGPERWAEDMKRQRILERVGWRFWRCWASSFTLDPDGCMADLFAMLEHMGIEPAGDERGGEHLTQHVVAKPAGGPATVARETPVPPEDAIRVGDRVLVQYLDDKKQLTLTLTHDQADIIKGFLPASSPLGQALLGCSEEDEIEYTVDGKTRRVLIRRIERPSQTRDAPSGKRAPEPPAANSALHAPKDVPSSDKDEASDKARADVPNVPTHAPEHPKAGMLASAPADPPVSFRSARPETAQATVAKPEHLRAGSQKPNVEVPAPLRTVLFSQGDRVRHPKYGHGCVKQVASEDVGGQRLDLVHIAFDDKSAVVKIPVGNASSLGLRNLSRGGVR